MPHLEDAPRGAAVDPQRLVQRTLSPQLLLPLGVSERGRVASEPLYRGGVAGAGRRGLGAMPSASCHHVALTPPHEGPLLRLWESVGTLAH
jgi:hypothetical protein